MSTRSRSKPWFRLGVDQWCIRCGWVTFAHRPIPWLCYDTALEHSILSDAPVDILVYEKLMPPWEVFDAYDVVDAFAQQRGPFIDHTGMLVDPIAF